MAPLDVMFPPEHRWGGSLIGLVGMCRGFFFGAIWQPLNLDDKLTCLKSYFMVPLVQNFAKKFVFGRFGA